MLKSDQFLISHHFFMLCQRKMSANKNPGEARGRRKGGGSVFAADEGREGEENGEERRMAESETIERAANTDQRVQSQRVNKMVFYIIAAQMQECITSQLIYNNILLKCPHVSFNASVPYSFGFTKAVCATNWVS